MSAKRLRNMIAAKLAREWSASVKDGFKLHTAGVGKGGRSPQFAVSAPKYRLYGYGPFNTVEEFHDWQEREST